MTSLAEKEIYISFHPSGENNITEHGLRDCIISNGATANVIAALVAYRSCRQGWSELMEEMEKKWWSVTSPFWFPILPVDSIYMDHPI